MRELNYEISDPFKDLPTTEQNLDVIRSSDWIIDLGPDGGDRGGGEIVVRGTPGEVAVHPTSLTGRCFKHVMEQHPPEPVAA